MILHLHHGRRACAPPWRLPEKCATHCEMATSLSLRLPLDCAHLPPECLGFSPHAVAVAGVRVCFRMVANICKRRIRSCDRAQNHPHLWLSEQQLGFQKPIASSDSIVQYPRIPSHFLRYELFPKLLSGSQHIFICTIC